MDKIIITDNEYEATHWIHLDSDQECSLVGGKIYPILDNWCGEERCKYVQADKQSIHTEWIKQYCIGYFVNLRGVSVENS